MGRRLAGFKGRREIAGKGRTESPPTGVMPGPRARHPRVLSVIKENVDGRDKPTAVRFAFDTAPASLRLYSIPPLSSWPCLSRPSTCSLAAGENVDARDKHGHDDSG